MADIHAVDYQIGDDGKPIPPKGGLIETRDLIFACILGVLDFEMRGQQPISIVVSGDNAATLIKSGGKGNLELCRTTYYFLWQGPTQSRFGPLNHSRVYAAYFLARQWQRKRRGEVDNEFPKIMERAFKAANAHEVSQEMVDWMIDMIDMASNLFVFADTIKELARDPLITFTRALGRPGGLAHIASPLHADSKIMDRSKFLSAK